LEECTLRVPLEISYRNVQKTDDIEDLIYEKCAKLEQVCNYITSCRVAIEKPQEHQKSGNPYRVRLDITVPPGHELVVKREVGEGEMHEGLTSVIRKVFNAARRKLKKLIEKQRGEVKKHQTQEARAVVVRLFHEEDYGFLQTLDGREFYFHRNSVLQNDFDHLERGTVVRFIEKEGEKGPQASSVQIVDKPGSSI